MKGTWNERLRPFLQAEFALRNTAIRSVQQQDILSSAPTGSAEIPSPDQNDASSTLELPPDVLVAIHGALEKKAEDFRIFDLRGVTSLTEYFLICSGGNQRQNQAISDEIYKLLKDSRKRPPLGVEGYEKADWILMDYGDFIVHVLSGQARKFYELERLWRQAKECSVPDDVSAQVAAILASANADASN